MLINFKTKIKVVTFIIFYYLVILLAWLVCKACLTNYLSLLCKCRLYNFDIYLLTANKCKKVPMGIIITLTRYEA